MKFFSSLPYTDFASILIFKKNNSSILERFKEPVFRSTSLVRFRSTCILYECVENFFFRTFFNKKRIFFLIRELIFNYFSSKNRNIFSTFVQFAAIFAKYATNYEILTILQFLLPVILKDFLSFYSILQVFVHLFKDFLGNMLYF